MSCSVPHSFPMAVSAPAPTAAPAHLAAASPGDDLVCKDDIDLSQPWNSSNLGTQSVLRQSNGKDSASQGTVEMRDQGLKGQGKC